MTNKHVTTFYLVRHGQTEMNVAEKIQGQIDSPLTQAGVQQAKDAAQKLKHLHFAAAFSSDLLRAHRTAQFIAAEHALEVTTTQILRERSFGKYEGWHAAQYAETLKDEIARLEKLSETERFQQSPDMENVETDEVVSQRLSTFLREVAVAYPDQNVLIVTHGGVMRSMLFRLGWATYNELPHYGVKNTGYIKLECDGVDFFVRETSGVEKQDILEKIK